MTVKFEIPTTLPSIANVREHWAPRHVRTSKLRQDAKIVCQALTSRSFAAAARAHGATITLVRVARRRYDRDNLATSFKPLQDGIADALGMNDGSQLSNWQYDQEHGQPDRVRVSIEVPG